MNYVDLYDKLRKNPLPKTELINILHNITGLFGENEFETELEILKSSGFSLEEKNELFFLKTTQTLWKDEIFCFVDIETTGSKPKESSIIEIGAIKYQHGKIIDKFKSFVYTKEVPEKITELTGIDSQKTMNSPCIEDVLIDFKIFLDESVFVAHNVNFDYSFISYHMNQIGLNEILNPKLCTIDLAHKTILSPRYSLAFLNEFLGINTPISHRAYEDALTSLKVFEISLHSLPFWVNTTQDLIDFSKGRKS